MISPSELVVRLKELKAAYLRERESLILKMANDATALMKLRVIESKVNDEGSIFGIYADSTLKTKRRNGRLSDSGNPSDINFSDTNRMWSGTGTSFDGVGARISVSDNNKIIATIHPHDDTDRINVLGILEDKFGNIVAWSKKEQELLISIYRSQFRDLAIKYGF